MNLSLIYGTVIGLLLGLAYCYWKQINVVYQNQGLIGAASSFSSDAQNLFGQIQQKL